MSNSSAWAKTPSWRGWIVPAVATVLTFLFVTVLVAFLMVLDTHNQQARVLNLYQAKIEANKADLANLKSKLPEAANVTEGQMKKLGELFTAYAAARTPESGDAVMRWVQESVPQVDQKTFTNLQNIVTSTRDAWAERQKELIDYARVYNTALDTQPSGFILRRLGWSPEKLKPPVVVTAGTDAAFQTGHDEPQVLFK